MDGASPIHSGEIQERRIYHFLPQWDIYYISSYVTDDLAEALTRHIDFYMTDYAWGGCINGLIISMEEQGK